MSSVVCSSLVSVCWVSGIAVGYLHQVPSARHWKGVDYGENLLLLSVPASVENIAKQSSR